MDGAADDDAMAIVGIGCKVPGAENIREFWRLLLKGENHIVEIPSTRWNAEACYDSDPLALGKSYVMRAGLVSGPDEFDNKLYSINDFEAGEMDPQQRFVLDCTIMAMEDAGITRAQLAGSNTGVFMGVMNSDHRTLFTAQCSNISNYTVTGISNSVIAARVSYVLDLRGPCLVLDTACSSSLIAIHLGCQAIRTGDCDVAICGGVNYFGLPDVFVHLSKARMISPSGQCHSFSHRADGYTRGEGCGVVILKRLRDAVRDGDNIWATIYTGVNQDGHTVAPITAPSGLQQIRLLEHIYSNLDIDVSGIDYIEAHGTGTVAGDPVEVNSLGEFFTGSTTPRTRYIGSVKTNIGHLESAAGVVGIIKVLLMMKNQKIVPSLHCDVPNPKIRFDEFLLKVPKEVVDWSNPVKMACCNSFGFGGSNGHALLRFYRKPVMSTEKSRVRRPCVVCFSAMSHKSLRAMMEELFVDPTVPRLSVHDISYTSTVRRDHYLLRHACVVEDVQELLGAIQEEITRDTDPTPVLRRPRVVFVFCGMGTAWPGMCTDLVDHLPVFRDVMLKVEQYLQPLVNWSLTDRLKQESTFDDPEFTPIAIFACQVALAAVWRDLGVEVGCVVGQSVGEVAAAHVAGCLGLEEAVRVVYHRTRLLAGVTGGKMTIVRNVAVEKVRGILAKYLGRASISLQYSALACCISADADVMPDVKADLTEQLRAHNEGMQLLDLDVCVAYHSHHVDATKQSLADALEGLSATLPRIPFASSVTGDWMTTEPGVQYWVDNLREPVLFDLAVQRSRDSAPHTVFLEIGPKPTLKAHLSDIFPKESVTAVASMQSKPEYKMFLKAVVDLYTLGVDVTWKNMPTQGHQVTDIPRYVFDKKKNLAKTEIAITALGGVDEGRRIHPYTYPVLNSNSFKLVISPLVCKFIYDHIISGRIVVPGAFYAEAGFAISKQLRHRGFQAVSVSADFIQAMTISKDDVTDIDVHEAEKSEDQWSFKIVKDNRLLASLHLATVGGAGCSPVQMVNVEHLRGRCTKFIAKDAIYRVLRQSGFQYGDSFRLLDHAYTNSTECLALIKLTRTIQEELAGTTIHPCILDCSLQSSLVISDPDVGHNLLPTSLGRLTVQRPMEAAMLVHTTLKLKNRGKNYYHLRLLSLQGHVIAELDDLEVSIITETHQRSLPDVFRMVWTPKLPLPDPEVTRDEKTLLILSDQETNGSPSPRQIHVTYTGVDFRTGLHQHVQKTLTSNKGADACILLFSKPFSDVADADDVDADILTFTFLLKGVVQVASDLSLSMPIFVCTCGAWPSDSQSHVTSPVNPTATALWGLVRSVVRERLYPRLVAVDLQLPPADLTPALVQRVFEVLVTSPDLRNYPEILVDKSWIFVNHLIVQDADTPIPQYRNTSADRNRTAVLLSRDPSAVVAPVIVHRSLDKRSCDTDHVTISSQVFALQTPALVHLKMRYEHLPVANPSLVGGYAVFSVEVLGQAVPTTGNKPGETVVACYPMTVATRVVVPASTTLPSTLLPNYQPGDLSTLIVIFQLLAQVSTPGVTIVSSRRTQSLAHLAESLLLTRKCGKDCFVVSVTMSEQLSTTPTLRDTIVSLTLLDGAAIAEMAPRWPNARYLVTCSGLVDGETKACAAMLLPDLDIRVVDTQTLFQSTSLRKVVPEVTKAIKKLGPEVARMTAALHEECGTSDDSPYTDGITDLAQMLTFRRWEMGQPQVNVGPDELFRKDACYLVVGGLTGLGWLCVQYLAQRGAGYIAILNRRQPSAESLSDMATLSASFTCHIRAFQGDVTSLQSLSTVMQQMQTEFSNIPLKGVFFGAAVTEDKSFLSMDVTSFDKALSPKVRGICNLHRLSRDLELDYFVMHSSVGSVIGNGGQTNYTAGNAFMDGMAHFRRQQGLAGQTLNWGALDLGLLHKNSLARQILESQGFIFMSKDEILSMLTPMLMLNWPQCSPMKIDIEKLTQRMNRDGMLPLRSRLEKILKSSTRQVEMSDNLLHEVQGARHLDVDHRKSLYENYIRFLAAQALSMDARAISPTASLIDMGMDSIVAMTMMNQIHRDTSCQLPVVLFVTGGPTVLSLAEALTEASKDEARRTEEMSSGDNGYNSSTTTKNSNNSINAKEIVSRDHLGPVIVEVKEKNPAEDRGSWEATPQETQGLRWYEQHPGIRSVFHGTVDVLLPPGFADLTRVRSAIMAARRRHPATHAVFVEGLADGKDWLTTLADEADVTLTTVADVENATSEKLRMLTHETFDLRREPPLRFILVLLSKPLLRMVFHKVAFDFHAALTFARDLRKFLIFPSNIATSANDTSLPRRPSVISTEQMTLLTSSKARATQFWQPLLRKTPAPVTLSSPPVNKADTGGSTHKTVTVDVSKSLVQAVRQYVSKRQLFLLGLVATSHQIVLHALTGKKVIPLVFPLNLRLVFNLLPGGVASLLSDGSSDVPLVAEFGHKNKLKMRPTLQSFVADNCLHILQCLDNGLLPFTMLDALTGQAMTYLHACAHGIAIEQTGGAVSEGHTTVSQDKDQGTALEVISEDSLEDIIPLPMDVETNLFVHHDFSRDLVRLKLAYRADVITRRRAEVIAHALIYVMDHVTTQPDVKLQAFVRQVRKFCRLGEGKNRKEL
ncbi:uncharacterized protein LOC112560253 [Pomacea canaliculata]|nr:uncharacterized protein LOC112560253 [Pomacea canaliculata]XP_025087739.1 uncharacterized protein LOC112560253 [Pomacea canaliculata]